MTEPLLTVVEVAALLRVSRRSVERLVATGRLRPTRIGSRTLFTHREVNAFVVAQTRRVA